MFLSDVLSCSGHIRINLHIIGLVMQVLGQGLEDALKPQNDENADILKMLQCFVWSNTLFQIYN